MPPQIQRYASCASHRRSSARAEPTFSSVAYSQSAVRTAGSIGGRPGPSVVARMRAYSGARSRPMTKSHTRRARWSADNRPSRSTVRNSSWARSGRCTRGTPRRTSRSSTNSAGGRSKRASMAGIVAALVRPGNPPDRIDSQPPDATTAGASRPARAVGGWTVAGRSRKAIKRGSATPGDATCWRPPRASQPVGTSERQRQIQMRCRFLLAGVEACEINEFDVLAGTCL